MMLRWWNQRTWFKLSQSTSFLKITEKSHLTKRRYGENTNSKQKKTSNITFDGDDRTWIGTQPLGVAVPSFAQSLCLSPNKNSPWSTYMTGRTICPKANPVNVASLSYPHPWLMIRLLHQPPQPCVVWYLILDISHWYTIILPSCCNSLAWMNPPSVLLPPS